MDFLNRANEPALLRKQLVGTAAEFIVVYGRRRVGKTELLVRTYSVCGGIPYYLERFSDDRPLAEHLLTEVFERTGLLRDEAELMLRQSIRDPANHIAVLRSIAHGFNRNSQIMDHRPAVSSRRR